LNQNQQKKVAKKSKRGPAKKEGPSVKEKMEILYEKVLDDLLINREWMDRVTSGDYQKYYKKIYN
jgi:hypothetical protein